MAVYKVPQDVEADDKLIGPFSFRQFIYLIIVAISIALAWGLAQLFIPLAIIPLPIILLFGALALPLRKDQPMEIYLAAIVSFHLKPRRRLWRADGIQSLIEITAPKVTEVVRAKDLTQSEAERRLSYLADIVDTQGWAIRGVASAQVPNAMQNDVYFAAQQTEDILANDGGVSQNFDAMINKADVQHRQKIIQSMHKPEFTTIAPQPTNTTPAPEVNPFIALAQQTPTPPINFNPYPSAMHQSVITPLSEQPAPQVQQQPMSQPTQQPSQPIAQQQLQQPQPPQTPQPQQPQPVVQQAAPVPTQPSAPAAPIATSENTVSPDIMNLANNHDLSIETLAREANRVRQKEVETSSDEIVISLR